MKKVNTVRLEKGVFHKAFGQMKEVISKESYPGVEMELTGQGVLFTRKGVTILIPMTNIQYMEVEANAAVTRKTA